MVNIKTLTACVIRLESSKMKATINQSPGCGPTTVKKTGVRSESNVAWYTGCRDIQAKSGNVDPSGLTTG